jgi:DGQHR domain-containing protein
MDKNNYIESIFIKISQPLGDFYIGKLKYKDLISIAYSDVRRIERDEQTGYETTFGIQRKLSEKRIKEIADYVTSMDATFPSSILLAIDEFTLDDSEEENFTMDKEPNISFNDETSILKIKRDEKLAHIIDGQHRVFGLKRAEEKGGLFSKEIDDFELVITIFVNMDDEHQALVFSTINKAHTKVNKSLVYDLYDLAKTRSPQRAVHNIVKLLNEKDNSPFKDKVKMLGFSEDASIETITQATLAELMLNYISKNPLKDRDYLKRGKKLQEIEGRGSEKYFFRNWFINQEDAKIAKVVWNYFKAIENKWAKAWWDTSLILSKSTGVIALMRFLKDIILKKSRTDTIVTVQEFSEIFEKINLQDADFTKETFESGGVGQSKLYNRLKSDSNL